MKMSGILEERSSNCSNLQNMPIFYSSQLFLCTLSLCITAYSIDIDIQNIFLTVKRNTINKEQPLDQLPKIILNFFDKDR